jgi:hypothetical protein
MRFLMAEKTPREILFESLQRNAEEVRSWPQWMREAVSTAHIFRVAPPKDGAEPTEAPDPKSDER